MARTDLQVPFSEKDEAKRLGARWDGDCKVWYVPDGVDSTPFKRWLPDGSEFNIRAPSYFIAETSKSCWKCGELTRLYGFVLPSGHETLEPAEDDEDREEWTPQDEPTIVSYVTDLLPKIVARINAFSKHYRLDFSKTTRSSYWMNHCEHCGMKQGDFEMYHEPQGAFFPVDEHDASQIVLHAIWEPFACSGDYSYGFELFAHTRRA